MSIKVNSVYDSNYPCACAKGLSTYSVRDMGILIRGEPEPGPNYTSAEKPEAVYIVRDLA